MQRSGQESQYMIDGIVLPCAADVKCSNEDTVSCAVSRSIQPPVSNQRFLFCRSIEILIFVLNCCINCIESRRN